MHPRWNSVMGRNRKSVTIDCYNTEHFQGLEYLGTALTMENKTGEKIKQRMLQKKKGSFVLQNIKRTKLLTLRNDGQTPADLCV